MEEKQMKEYSLEQNVYREVIHQATENRDRFQLYRVQHLSMRQARQWVAYLT